MNLAQRPYERNLSFIGPGLIIENNIKENRDLGLRKRKEYIPDPIRDPFNLGFLSLILSYGSLI